MHQRPLVVPPNAARLIEALRDTGYDFNTALADIVDNSIDADATLIKIQINMDEDGDVLVSVADNGYGMDDSELIKGMTYGSPDQPDPKRLGKFGIGLKTASSAFAKKVSVVTRDRETQQVSKATWDLDHVASKNEWELLLDGPDGYELELLDDVSEGHAGTVVLWYNIDRLMKQYATPTGRPARKALGKLINEFRDHAAMVYQRFLDSSDDRARNIDLLVNDSKVEPWDPFCKNHPETQIVANERLPVELPNGEAEFVITAYVLPRREYFDTKEEAQDARLSNKMQGFYIYRENRLIHPADWLGMFAKEPHFTLLRVEFSFEHALDRAFDVDLKKSRILLDENLYDYLLNNFIPAPRNAAEERYRKGRRIQIQNKAEGAHSASNKNIESKVKEISNTQTNVINAATGEVEVTNKEGKFTLKLKVDNKPELENVYINTVSSIDDGLLWEPSIIHGNHAVQLNTSHPYYQKVYVPNHSEDVIITGLDSLMWALVEAELSTINQHTKTHFQNLRFEVSRLLRELVESLPEPELD